MLVIEVHNLKQVEAMLEYMDVNLYPQVLEPTLAEVLALMDFEAQVHVPVLLGTLKASIQQVAPRNHPVERMANAKLVATAPYAWWVENGFRPHFVPLHYSYELQIWAKRNRGWVNTPSPEGVPPGRVYMKDAEGNLHWGVMTSGRAQPFMRPAKMQGELVAPAILAEHVRAAFSVL